MTFGGVFVVAIGFTKPTPIVSFLVGGLQIGLLGVLIALYETLFITTIRLFLLGGRDEELVYFIELNNRIYSIRI